MASRLPFVTWIVLFIQYIIVNGEISDLRLCANPTCDKPISYARTLIKYFGHDKYSLSFPPNEEIIIYSKSAGNVPHLWGGSGIISDKQRELNNSNKEQQVEATSDLPKIVEDIQLNDKNVNEEHIKTGEIFAAENTSENELLGVSANKDSVTHELVAEQKLASSSVKPSDDVIKTEIVYSRASTGEFTLESSPEQLQISSSTEDYSYMPSSAFNPSPSLTNIVAHTKEAPHSGDDELLNSAVWFPEDKKPSRSFFGYGVSADSSVNDKPSEANAIFTSELGRIDGKPGNEVNEKYVMVDGTPLPLDDEDPGITTTLPNEVSLGNPSLASSLLTTSGQGMSDLYGSNSATAEISNVQDTPIIEPTDSTISAEPSLQLNDVTVSPHKASDIDVTIEPTKVDNGLSTDPGMPLVKSSEKGSGEEPTQVLGKQGNEEQEAKSNGWFGGITEFLTINDESDSKGTVDIYNKIGFEEIPIKESDSPSTQQKEEEHLNTQFNEASILEGKNKDETDTKENDIATPEKVGDEEDVDDEEDEDDEQDSDPVDDAEEDEDDTTADLQKSEENVNGFGTIKVNPEADLPNEKLTNEKSYYDNIMKGNEELNLNKPKQEKSSDIVPNLTNEPSKSEMPDSSMNVAKENEPTPVTESVTNGIQHTASSANTDDVNDVTAKFESSPSTVDSISIEKDESVPSDNPELPYSDINQNLRNNEESLSNLTETANQDFIEGNSADIESNNETNERESDEVSAPNDLSGDISVPTEATTTEPTVGNEDWSNTFISDELVTESSITYTPDSDASQKMSHDWKQNVEEDSGTCEGPGIDGACGSQVEDFASVPHSSDRQDFWETLSSYVLVIRSYMQTTLDYLPEPLKIMLYDLEKSAVSPRVVIFVILVGSFLFLLEVSFIAIKTRFKEASLNGRISSLDQKLFTVTKERDILKSKMESYDHQNWEGEYLEAQSTIHALQAKLKVSQSECGKLQGSVASLEEQLETATDAGLELNQLLSDFLTSQNDSGRLQNAVLQFQEQLDGQQNKISAMQLESEATQREKAELNEELKIVRENYDLMIQNNKKATEELECLQLVKDELQQLINSKDDDINQLRESNKQLLQEAEVWDESVKQLQIKNVEDQSSIQKLQDAITFKNNEIEALKDCLLKLKIAQGKRDGDIIDDNEDDSSTSKQEDILEKLMDVSCIKAELKLIIDERDSILSKLEVQTNARIAAEEKAKLCADDSERLKAEYETAHLEREEAQTKLNVLSNYFKEKEMQLQKELGVQEAQRQQSQESVVSVTQRIATYEQEINLYKSQISSLKAEIDNQERSYKSQLTSHEKKAHENWLAARAAERKLEESKQEAAVLRNKLTLLEQEKAHQALNQSELSKSSIQNYPDSNGEVPSPPRLGPSDRSDSMDLPTSSRSSIFSRDPMDILHGLPFLPPDRPLPPPFMRGLPPGGMLPPPLLPPMNDRLPLPPPLPFDPRRGMFPMHPPPPGIGGGLPPEHWMGPRRRGSPPPYDHPSQRDRQSPPLLSQHSPPPFDRRPSSSRNTVSPLEPDPRDMGAYDRDYRDRTPPNRFYEPPMRPGFGHSAHGHPSSLAMKGNGSSKPPPKRDNYLSGRADGSIDPRTSSPMTSKQDGNGSTV